MFGDYHIHLDKLDWSKETIGQIVKRAGEVGVDEVGIVVHTKCLNGFEPLYSHVLSDGLEHKKLKFDKDIERYISLLTWAKDKGYPIKIGVEVCYSPDGEEFLKDVLKKYPFDYTIGSIHLIGTMHFKTILECLKDKEKVGEMYYNLILSAVRSKLFNIIGHIEIVRREGIPKIDHYPEIFDSICEALTQNDCAVEINTKWLIKHGYLVPDKSALSYMKEKGVKVVFGSDAHHKTRIGFAKDIAAMVIKDAGFEGFSMI